MSRENSQALQVGLWGKSGFSPQIREALPAAGFRIVELAEGEESDRFDIYILTDSGRRLRARVSSLGASASRTLVVASYSDAAEAAPDMSVGDILFWPGKPNELAFRIRRLAKATAVPDDVYREIAEPNLLGRSASFRHSCAMLRTFAPSHLPVLVEGETGTGKELAARALHYLSDRKDSPFVPVNCGSLPEVLFENELFGHRAGAYTDAKASAEGLVRQAEGGTLFLDEIEALSRHGQVSVLRFLENREYRPIGGGELRQADVRIVAASNAPLLDEVERGGFRQDLYYRLAVCQIAMPPLRDRPGDSRLLAEAFAQRINKRRNGYVCELCEETLEWIDRQPWPGNVRELENFIEREALLGRTRRAPHPVAQQVAAEGAEGDPAVPAEPFSQSKKQAIDAFEADYVERVMYQADGNVSLAARIAGKERRAFGRLLKKHGIDRRRFTSSRR